MRYSWSVSWVSVIALSYFLFAWLDSLFKFGFLLVLMGILFIVMTIDGTVKHRVGIYLKNSIKFGQVNSDHSNALAFDLSDISLYS